MTDERKLSDADLDALVDRLEERLAERFFGGVGKGVTKMVMDLVKPVLIGLFLYGLAWYATHHTPPQLPLTTSSQ